MYNKYIAQKEATINPYKIQRNPTGTNTPGAIVLIWLSK
jgi:hypothetical protein